MALLLATHTYEHTANCDVYGCFPQSEPPYKALTPVTAPKATHSPAVNHLNLAYCGASKDQAIRA